LRWTDQLRGDRHCQDLSGEIAVRADASRLDFAGVSLLALETPLESNAARA